MKIGRYEIKFGRYLKRLEDARPWDVDQVQQFLPGTPMEYGGRKYRYYRVKMDHQEVVNGKDNHGRR